MSLILNKIKISNFLSFGERIEIELTNQGLCLVKGENKSDLNCQSNMSGKSAFFDAISWCLYGNPFRDIKSKSVIRDGADYCEVSLWINDAQITRRISKQNPNELYLQKTSIEQITLERDFLKISFLQFISTVLFGDEISNKKVTRFAEGNNSDRFALLVPMLNIDTWERGKVNADAKVDGLSTDIRQQEIELIKLQNSNQSLLFKIAEKKENLSPLKDEFRGLEQAQAKESVDLKHQLREIDSGLKAKQTHALSKVNVVALEKLMQIIQDVDKPDLRAKADDQYQERTKLNAREKELRSEYSRQEVLLKQKHTLVQNIQCPLCNGTLTSEIKKSIKAVISESEKTICKVEKELRDLDILKNTVETTILSIRGLAEQKDRDKDMLQKQLTEKRSFDAETSKLESSFTHCQKALDAITARYSEQQTSLQDKIKKADIELSTLQVDYDMSFAKESQRAANIELLKKEKEHYAFWIKGYGNEGALNIEFREMLPLLNEKIQELIPQLLSSAYQIEVVGQRQLKSNKHRIKNEANLNLLGEFYRCSHSEKQKINAIIQIALGQLYGVQCNCLFFDEFFSGLDNSGVQASTELFRNLLAIQEHLSSVFVISHADVPDFDNQLTFIKEKGVTRLL